MVPVIFDSDYEQPITLSDMLNSERTDRWCMELHACAGLIHGVSMDARRALCIYEAPDAQAVRRVVEHFGNPGFLRTWTATGIYRAGYDRAGWPWGKGRFAITFHDLSGAGGSPPDGPPLDDPPPDDPLHGGLARFQGASEPDPAVGVRIIGDFLSLDRRRAIRLYQTPDFEAVGRIVGPVAPRDLFIAVAHED